MHETDYTDKSRLLDLFAKIALDQNFSRSVIRNKELLSEMNACYVDQRKWVEDAILHDKPFDPEKYRYSCDRIEALGIEDALLHWRNAPIYD